MIDKISLSETLSVILPPEAEVECFFDREAFVANFCWLLHTDPNRPFKRSKRVEFIVTPRALEDFKKIGNKQEAKVQLNLELYLSHKLETFEPDHDSLEGQAEPVERWKIDSLLFMDELDAIKGKSQRLF